MRVIIIGGKGHVGTYLVPRLAEAGHEVICISRNQREPYQPHRAWTQVQMVEIDRDQADEQGTFGQQISARCGSRRYFATSYLIRVVLEGLAVADWSGCRLYGFHRRSAGNFDVSRWTAKGHRDRTMGGILSLWISLYLYDPYP